MRQSRLTELVLVSLFAAIMIVLDMLPKIAVPLLPAPVTAQTLGVMLAGTVLGARGGFLSQVVFLLLVAVGIRGSGSAGLGAFMGPTAGFMLGWPLGAAVSGWLSDYAAQRYRRQRRAQMALMAVANIIGGVLVVYATGIPGMYLLGGIPLKVAAVGSLVYLPGDLVKVAAAVVLGLALRRAMATAGLGRAANLRPL